jgi:23S rRNA pseudouridine1911/1915/1917 synthase
MICTKNSTALAWLQKQFSTRKVVKTYVAVVTGTPKELEAVIDIPIERNPKAPATFRAGSGGRSAQTHLRVLQQADGYSLLELRPLTGRTHQLRVHLKYTGHPIVGDMLYGGVAAPRLLLHAKDLTITLPDQKSHSFEAPIPAEFKQFMDQHGG